MMISVPEELDLEIFFESEPVTADHEERFYRYNYIDSNGIELSFSFHTIEGSIQAMLKHKSNTIAVVCEEMATAITLGKDNYGEYMTCTFSSEKTSSKANIRLKPHITIDWSTLEK